MTCRPRMMFNLEAVIGKKNLIQSLGSSIGLYIYSGGYIKLEHLHTVRFSNITKILVPALTGTIG